MRSRALLKGRDEPRKGWGGDEASESVGIEVGSGEKQAAPEGSPAREEQTIRPAFGPVNTHCRVLPPWPDLTQCPPELGSGRTLAALSEGG